MESRGLIHMLQQAPRGADDDIGTMNLLCLILQVLQKFEQGTIKTNTTRRESLHHVSVSHNMPRKQGANEVQLLKAYMSVYIGKYNISINTTDSPTYFSEGLRQLH